MKNIFIIGLLLCGCSRIEDTIEKHEKIAIIKDSTNSISYKKFRDYEEIRTVVHDKHWFILWTENIKGGILHHPDCPVCKK